MGCVSTKTDDPNKQPYGHTASETTGEVSGTVTRSEPEVGYDVTRETVKVSRDAGDVQIHAKSSSSSSSSHERRRTVEEPTSSDVAERPSSTKAPPVRTGVRSTGSTSGVRRSGALSSSGSGEDPAVAAQVDGVDDKVGGRSAVAHGAGERRRKRTSRTPDVETDARHSSPRHDAAGNGGIAVSDVQPDVEALKVSDPVVNQKPGRKGDHVVNGHVDAPVTVAKDATAALSARTSAKDRRKFDEDVIPLKTSDHKETTTFEPIIVNRDSEHKVKGDTEIPVVVAKDATTVVTDGPRSPAEDHRKADKKETDAKQKNGEQVSSLPASVDRQTDIKPVNPDMAIFDVLHRQQADKQHSGSDDSNVPTSTSSERHKPKHSNDIETPTTTEVDKTATAEAEVTSSVTSSVTSTAVTTHTTPVVAAPAAERSSIPRSKVLVSQTSVEATDRSHRKPAEMNGEVFISESGQKAKITDTTNQLNDEVGSVQTSKLAGRSSTVSAQQPTSPTNLQQPTSPTTVGVDSPTASSTPASPPISPVWAGTYEERAPGAIREVLLDLTADNKSIASRHRLYPKTRSSVLQAVEDWFGGSREPPAEGSSRVMAIHGPAGCGKTCVSAELCRRYSGKKQLMAGHFFYWRVTRPDHNRIATVLLGLAHRMCQLVAGYAEALPPNDVLVSQVDRRNLVELFDMLVTQPLRRVQLPEPLSTETIQPSSSGSRRLIVLDGLDECDPGDRELLFQLMNTFDVTTPDWLYVLVTVRDDDDDAQLVLKLNTAQKLELKADVADVETVADVRRYLRDAMARRIDRISLDGALAQLAKNAEANFLCAKFLKNKLDGLPEGSKLALRDLSLTFPVGLADICRQAFQVLQNRLLERDKSTSKKSRENVAYNNVVSLLVAAREPLPTTAFRPTNDEELFAEMSGTVDMEDGRASLHHRAVAEWLVSDGAHPPLRVAVPAARQAMTDAVMAWLAPVIGDDSGGTSVDERLTEYAVKHAVYHLTDVGKQAENVARVLCSLRYIQQKLKPTPGIPSSVALRYLLDDYEHSHYQEAGASATWKMVTLSSTFKRTSGLTEQVDLMKKFIVRRAPALKQVGAEFALHVAANYPSVARIQDNARLDLASSPWLEHVTAVTDTRPVRHGAVRGVVVDVDVAADQRQLAVVTRLDDADSAAFLYVINSSTADSVLPEPIDISKLPDRVGLCVRFLPTTGGVGSGGGAVFVGSLRQFVAVRGGRPVDSGLDVASIKLNERYSIECCTVSGGTLAVGLSTLPWGGRSLHLAIFDVQSRKCLRTIEALKFRFGGSAQFGVKAVGLSSDAGVVCACVKQTKVKVMAWKTSSGELLSGVEVDDDGLTKCLVLGPSTQTTVMLSAAARTSSSSKSGQRPPRCYRWSPKDSSPRLITQDRRYDSSLGHVTAQQTAVTVQWRRGGSSATLNCWSKPDFDKPPDRKYIIYGLDDDVIEIVATDRSVVFVSATRFSVYGLQDLQTVEIDGDGVFEATDSVVDSVGFVPRSDDPVVAFYPSSMDASLGCAACLLVVRSGEAPVVGSQLFAPEPTSDSAGCDVIDRERVFAAPARFAYTADASCALIRDSQSVRTRDLSTSTTRVLPVADNVTDKMATVDSDNNSATGNVLMFAVSPKDSLIGLVYRQSRHAIQLFDAKTPATGGKPVVVLKDDQSGAVTDFSFLPANGYVVSYYRMSGEALMVWNHKSGVTVSRDTGVDVRYIRLSPASDRMAVSMRCSEATGNGSALILRSGDNRFSVSLSTAVTWAAEPSSSDVEFSGDGTVLVGFCDGFVSVWNAGSGELLRTFDGQCCSPEVVGWPTNIHAVLHDPSNERLLVVDVISGSVVAAASTDGRVDRKWSTRRLRISPRGGVVVGSTFHGELRAFVCRNMASIRRQTSLQAIKSATAATSPK